MEEVKATAQKSVESAVKELGIETYQPDTPNCLVFFEVYKSKEAHEAHLQTEHFYIFSIVRFLFRRPVWVYVL